MRHWLEKLQVENSTHQALRRRKDQLFRPVAQGLERWHVTPYHVTLVGVMLGLSGAAILPWHYWSALALLSISTLCDGVDGTLARLLQQSSRNGAQFDYWSDVSIATSIYVATVVWLQEPIWLLGLGLQLILMLVNRRLGAPLQLAPNRMLLFILLLLHLPRVALACFIGYTLIMGATLLGRIVQQKKSQAARR